MSMKNKQRKRVNSRKGSKPNYMPGQNNIVKFQTRSEKEAELAKEKAFNERFDSITIYLMWFFSLVISAPISAIYMAFVIIKENKKHEEDESYKPKYKVIAYISFALGILYCIGAFYFALSSALTGALS